MDIGGKKMRMMLKVFTFIATVTIATIVATIITLRQKPVMIPIPKREYEEY